MKRMTIGIIVIGTIIFGLLFNFVLQARRKGDDNGPKLNKVCRDISDVNASLNKISEVYIENLDKVQEGKPIYKKDLADSIQIDYEKFLKYTKSEQDEILTTQQVLNILNSYYENSGINENIKNKLKSIRVELEVIKITNEKEKNIYAQIVNIHGKIVEYYEAIFNFRGEIEEYRNIITFEKENIIILIKDMLEKH